MKIDLISVVPSPYQRDLFRALAAEPDCTLRVHYLEHSAPDSPWPTPALAPYETVLPGWTAGRGRVRCHTNWGLPDFADTDVAILNAALTGITTQQVMQRLCKRGVPWVFWGESLRQRTGISRALQNALTAKLHRASSIVAIGSVAKADYRRRFPHTPTYQLPYYCDLSEFSEAAKSNTALNPDPVFLFCGQMIERKGIDVLIDAFRFAWERGLKARLLLVGRETALLTRLDALPGEVRNSIEIAGFQPPEDLPKFFARADVFVLPSRHDGWGVVVNQALGAGLPVITTHNVGAARDLVSQDVNGLIVPPGDSAPLADALLKLGHQHALRSSMSEQSRSKAAQLSPTAGAQSFLSILRKVLETDISLVS